MFINSNGGLTAFSSTMSYNDCPNRMMCGSRLDVVGEAHHTVVIDDDDHHLILSSTSINNKHKFNTQLFASSHCWGRHPLLVRHAFDPSLLLNNHNVDEYYDGNDYEVRDAAWPSWKDVVEIATDEESESRIISHISGDNSSFELNWGPLTKKDARTWCNKLSSSTSLQLEPKAIGKTRRETLVVNDVDRFYPSLADWMYDTFKFLPNWRKDDGQISLAEYGGGIGLHVDNYDVFLIQMSGTRTWQVGRRKISAQEERDRTIDGLDVRVLDQWGHVGSNDESSEMQHFTVHPGDMLYLPPRVAHCGTSLSNDCMTLSVGCRAPSVSDMVSKLAEKFSSSMDEYALRRYMDSDILIGLDGIMKPGELTHDAKEMARKLVLDSLSLTINDDEWWDKFFGKYVTEQKRVRSNYPIPLKDSSFEDNDWNDAHLTVSNVVSGKGFLYQAEGIALAYSCVPSNLHFGRTFNRFFVDGEMWQSKCQVNTDDWTQIFQIVANNRRLDRLCLLGLDGNDGQKVRDDIILPAEAILFLEELVSAGFLIGSVS